MGVMLGRRAFLSGAMGATLSALPMGTRLAFSATTGKEPILFVMLRGGMDGLNMVAPIDDANLLAARSTAIIPTTGNALANGPTAQDWRLNVNAPELYSLYQAGHLAFVHAAGAPYASRSHFEMQQLTETGQLDLTQVATLGGWIGRYALQSGVAGTFAVAAAGVATLPLSLSDDLAAIDILSASTFKLRSTDKVKFVQQAYTGGAPGTLAAALDQQAADMIGATQGFQTINTGYTPPAGYGTDSLSVGLSIAAELMKAGAGIQLGAFEYDDWDTHVNEPATFSKSAAILSKALYAFYNDITAAGLNATVIVASEFGRRVAGNASGGTDHGHGNVVMALGPSVRGGAIYGAWPGLAPAQTDQGDVAVMTDTRQVFLEAINARRGDAPAGLFPNLTLTAQPLNLFVANPSAMRIRP